MCTSDDENNETYPEIYNSDVKTPVPVAAVTTDGIWQMRYGLTHC